MLASTSLPSEHYFPSNDLIVWDLFDLVPALDDVICHGE
jgi:hypothetical protein